MLSVLIVDDHPLFRDAMINILQELDHDHRALEAGSVTEALTTLEGGTDLDLILLDLFLPGTQGLDGLDALRARAPTIPIVIVSAWSDRAPILQAIEQGAVGFIPKTSARRVFVRALTQVLDGAIYLPADVLRQTGRPRQQAVPTVAFDRLAELTRMQRTVLTHIAQGLSNKEIARVLGLAEPTVKGHVSALLRKLQLETRAQVIAATGPILSQLGIADTAAAGRRHDGG